MQRTDRNKIESDISPRIEKILEDIDTRKVKMKTYTFDEHIEYIKKILKEK